MRVGRIEWVYDGGSGFSGLMEPMASYCAAGDVGTEVTDRSLLPGTRISVSLCNRYA